MNTHYGEGLASAITDLPDILVKYITTKGEERERAVAAVGLLTAAIQGAIRDGNITQHEVMTALVVIMAGLQVMPNKGMLQEEASELIADAFDDYATVIAHHVTNGKPQNHASTTTVN